MLRIFDDNAASAQKLGFFFFSSIHFVHLVVLLARSKPAVTHTERKHISSSHFIFIFSKRLRPQKKMSCVCQNVHCPNYTYLETALNSARRVHNISHGLRPTFPKLIFGHFFFISIHTTSFRITESRMIFNFCVMTICCFCFSLDMLLGRPSISKVSFALWAFKTQKEIRNEKILINKSLITCWQLLKTYYSFLFSIFGRFHWCCTAAISLWTTILSPGRLIISDFWFWLQRESWCSCL